MRNDNLNKVSFKLPRETINDIWHMHTGKMLHIFTIVGGYDVNINLPTIPVGIIV